MRTCANFLKLIIQQIFSHLSVALLYENKDTFLFLKVSRIWKWITVCIVAKIVDLAFTFIIFKDLLLISMFINLLRSTYLNWAEMQKECGHIQENSQETSFPSTRIEYLLLFFVQQNICNFILFLFLYFTYFLYIIIYYCIYQMDWFCFIYILMCSSILCKDPIVCVIIVKGLEFLWNCLIIIIMYNDCCRTIGMCWKKEYNYLFHGVLLNIRICFFVVRTARNLKMRKLMLQL